MTIYVIQLLYLFLSLLQWNKRLHFKCKLQIFENHLSYWQNWLAMSEINLENDQSKCRIYIWYLGNSFCKKVGKLKKQIFLSFYMWFYCYDFQTCRHKEFFQHFVYLFYLSVWGFWSPALNCFREKLKFLSTITVITSWVILV